jgi:hypothetical protein
MQIRSSSLAAVAVHLVTSARYPVKASLAAAEAVAAWFPTAVVEVEVAST